MVGASVIAACLIALIFLTPRIQRKLNSGTGSSGSRHQKAPPRRTSTILFPAMISGVGY
jgi:hypothetical protein